MPVSDILIYVLQTATISLTNRAPYVCNNYYGYKFEGRALQED